LQLRRLAPWLCLMRALSQQAWHQRRKRPGRLHQHEVAHCLRLRDLARLSQQHVHPPPRKKAPLWPLCSLTPMTTVVLSPPSPLLMTTMATVMETQLCSSSQTLRAVMQGLTKSSAQLVMALPPQSSSIQVNRIAAVDRAVPKTGVGAGREAQCGTALLATAQGHRQLATPHEIVTASASTSVTVTVAVLWAVRP
jgi:hypothetical protein